MKQTLQLWAIFLPTMALFSCGQTSQPDNITIQKFADTLVNKHSISSKMTFFDNDSIYNQSFQTESVFDGEMLKWEIKFLENGELQTIQKDSINSMSYLVEALDLNSDGTGELVVVTGKTYPAFDNLATMRCQIFCYVRQNQEWIKKSAPELTSKQLQGYYGNEVLSIEKNKILRIYPIYNDKKEETGKNRTLLYGLDKNFELVILQEK